jgi:predicted nuclease of predicted toxin-antitoxin system
VRLKLDENLPRRLADHLAAAGHTIDTIVDEDLVGAEDEAVLDAAAVAGRVLITLDRGLGERALRTGSHGGVIVLRPPTQSVDDVIATFSSFLRERVLPDLANAVAVVQPSRVRIRRR